MIRTSGTFARSRVFQIFAFATASLLYAASARADLAPINCTLTSTPASMLTSSLVSIGDGNPSLDIDYAVLQPTNAGVVTINVQLACSSSSPLTAGAAGTVTGNGTGSISVSYTTAFDFNGGESGTTVFFAQVTNTDGVIDDVTLAEGYSQGTAPTDVLTAVIAPVSGAQVGMPITLNGSQSTSSLGESLSYSWQVLSGPADVQLENAGTAQATFEPSVAGNYSVQLTIADSQGNSQSATTSILVNSIAANASLAISAVHFWQVIRARLPENSGHF